MRLALASLLLLAACQRGPAPAANQAEAPPPAPPPPAAEADTAAAERLVRQRLGTSGEIHFVESHRGTSEGVPVVCGAYEQSGVRRRYIVVGGNEAFIEPRMRPGEMDRAFGEFCGDGERG